MAGVVTLARGLYDRLPPRLKRRLAALGSRWFDIYSVKSYSQEGEDMILRRMFVGRARGFYVDVGAHHPRRFSNTFLFYCRGWRGINIEPNPDAIELFAAERKGDTNLQLGIAAQAGTLTYYKFDEPALNTFDREMVESRLATTSYRVASTMPVAVERLDSVLGRHLPHGTQIDFLSVDVEGLDCEVLKSNDWLRYRPTCVVVEALRETLEGAIAGETTSLMTQQGYELVAKTLNSLIFREMPPSRAAQ